MMPDKGEILADAQVMAQLDPSDQKFCEEVIYPAMDEYAEGVGMAYMDWMLDRMFPNLKDQIVTKEHKKELYQLFINSQTK